MLLYGPHTFYCKAGKCATLFKVLKVCQEQLMRLQFIRIVAIHFYFNNALIGMLCPVILMKQPLIIFAWNTKPLRICWLFILTASLCRTPYLCIQCFGRCVTVRQMFDLNNSLPLADVYSSFFHKVPALTWWVVEEWLQYTWLLAKRLRKTHAA